MHCIEVLPSSSMSILMCHINCSRSVTFSHVLYNRLEIDINVLCDYMDHLCGALLFATYLKRWNSLHGLTLPKSWIVRQARDAHQVASMHVKSLEKYTAFASLLIQRLRTGDNASQCPSRFACQLSP